MSPEPGLLNAGDSVRELRVQWGIQTSQDIQIGWDPGKLRRGMGWRHLILKVSE